MIYLKKYIKFIAYALLCVFVVGCVSAKYVERKQYLLDTPILLERKVAKKIDQNKCAVFVDHVTAVPPFDQLDFIYRVGANQYVTDYYHGFLVLPTRQLDQILINYLKATGGFNLETTELLSQKQLRIQIKELYADYRDFLNPKAVVVIYFLLTKLVDNKQVVLLEETIRSNIALKEKNSESLLNGWGIGIQNILIREIKKVSNLLLEQNMKLQS